ncbi:hypothetical protein [Faecalibacterium sp. An77]|uniref:hypothetical protein n=1 Tax=Faecalibacterium sp. An77 TaxID=1965655 RepID=UPI001302255B|nr:hypothetical protein [Faecalibacterium sp. An77]
MNGLEWIVRIAAGLGGGVLVLFLLAGTAGTICAAILSGRTDREEKSREAPSEQT